MKKFILFLFLSISVYSQSSIAVGDILILSINGDLQAPTYGRGFSFMPLDNLQPGTVIYFTDYGWSDVGGTFITNTSVADIL